ncbi:hypothetical protein ACIG5E_00560 [Kitasatospora sp. NPDC053057]|uniref:hypothetical protein n=1 Tax=Kitasatospora sp. NPDC053057 TaxID=3364062 RepID=UPI0037CC3C12
MDGERAREGFCRLLQIGLSGSSDEADTVADICEHFALGGENCRNWVQRSG